MKKALLLVFVFISIASFAQDAKPKMKIPKFASKQDKLILNLNWDNWLNTPAGVTTKAFRSRGFSFLFMNEKIYGEGNVALAWGLGFSSQNVHSNAFPTFNADISKTYLVPFPSTVEYDLNKLSCNFIDAALEFRYRTDENENRKRFKISVGIKGGYLVQSHTKYEDSEGKTKTYDIKNLSKFQYGVIARIGYGKWGISGYYSLIPLFKDGKGPDVVPISIGLSYAI
jgi:hypothetical protein